MTNKLYTQAELDQAVAEAREKLLDEIEEDLSIAEDFSGFITISNHVPYAMWESLRAKHEEVKE